MAVEASLYGEVFMRADIGLAVLSPQGEWLAANACLCRALARPAEALVGTRAHERVFDPETARRLADLVASAQGGADGREIEVGIEGAGEGAQEGGGAWRVRASALPDSDGQAAVLLQFEDLGPVRRIQAAAAHEQDLLAYGLSHELRAPLRGIAGFAARLTEPGAVDAAAAPAELERIRTAAARAEGLIDALLELLRASRQPLRRDSVDISLLGEWVASELRDAEPGREADVRVQPGLYALGDEHWLKSMLHKLLENAWKFSAARARVEISVEGTAGDDGLLRLQIRDRGCGFDMRYAGKLFSPFQRLHGAEQGGGSGLGLATAQRIAERHGGRIRAQSAPGQGSTFFIELPAAAGSTT